MSTSVVIVAYRPHEWLERCLASVVGQADEIVLVDNGSPGTTIRSHGERVGAHVVRLATNAGFPAGVNAGVAAAHGDVIALLNDDAFAGSNWLARSCDVLADPAIGAVGPKLVYASPFAELALDDDPHFVPGDARPLGRVVRSITVDGADRLAAARGAGLHGLERDATGAFRWTAGRTPFYVPAAQGAAIAIDGVAVTPSRSVQLVNSAGMHLHADGYAGDLGDGEPDDGQYDTPADRFGLCGAALVTRRDTWARVGPLAAEFFAYYEDTDWCWRAQRAGYRLRYEPSMVVHHVGGASSGGLHDDRTRLLYQRNRVLTLVRNAPGPVAWPALREVLLHERRFATPGLRRATLAMLPKAGAVRFRS